MRRQTRVLDSGDERAKIELRRRGCGRWQATGGLPLRRVQLELAPVETHEERVLVRYPVIDTSREGIFSNVPVDGRRVVVEIPRAVRKRIDAGDVSTHGVDPIWRNDVSGIGIPEELWIRAAHRFGRIKVGIQPGRQRIVD